MNDWPGHLQTRGFWNSWLTFGCFQRSYYKPWQPVLSPLVPSVEAKLLYHLAFFKSMQNELKNHCYRLSLGIRADFGFHQ